MANHETDVPEGRHGLGEGATGSDDVLHKAHEFPGAYGPSMRFAVPYSFVSPRTMMKGRSDAIAAEAASATAPRAGPARPHDLWLDLPGSVREPHTELPQQLRLGLEAVLVEVVGRAPAGAEDEVAFEQRVLDEEADLEDAVIRADASVAASTRSSRSGEPGSSDTVEPSS